MSSQPTPELITDSRYPELQELGLWMKNCAAILRSSIQSFPDFGRLTSNSYSDHYSELTAKVFFISKSLQDLLDASSFLFDSAEKLTKNSFISPKQPSFMNSFRNAHYKAQSGMNRQLFELLVTLISFSGTNEEDYFKHFLLLTELDQLLGKAADEKEFFRKPAILINLRIAKHREAIFDLEDKNQSLRTAWYQTDKNISQQNNANRYLRPGSNLKSFRQRFLGLDGILDDFQKLSLGFSYGALYSHSSRSIHSTPSHVFNPAFNEITDIVAEITSQAFLSLAILKQLSALAVHQIHNLDSEIDSLKEQLKPVTQRMYAHFKKGDLVIINGGLAEVTGQITGRFGYLSYSVQFLADPPAEIDDSYIASYLTLFVTADSLLELMRSLPNHDSKNEAHILAEAKRTWPKWGLSLWEPYKQACKGSSVELPNSSKSRI